MVGVVNSSIFVISPSLYLYAMQQEISSLIKTSLFNDIHTLVMRI